MNPDEPLRTKNLAEEDPAPMDDTLGGYPWLPRMIDKARAAQAGQLGHYFKYPCPIDTACLLLLGIASEAFGAAAARAVIAREVVQRLVDLGADLDAARSFDPVALNEAIHGADGS